MNNLPDDSHNKSEIILYQTEDGKSRIEVKLHDETVWLSQKLMAELFQKDVRTINEHIKNTYAEGELRPDSTIRKFRIVQAEGKRQVTREVDFFNLKNSEWLTSMLPLRWSVILWRQSRR